jgi:hypothetical protein
LPVGIGDIPEAEAVVKVVRSNSGQEIVVQFGVVFGSQRHEDFLANGAGHWAKEKSVHDFPARRMKPFGNLVVSREVNVTAKKKK